MNAITLLRVLSIVLVIITLVFAVYTVANGGSAGAPLILMVATLIVLAAYREKAKERQP